MSLKDQLHKIQRQHNEAYRIINENQNKFQGEQLEMITLKETNSEYQKLVNE